MMPNALWGYAFRPFFALAALHAVIMPLIWVAALFGLLPMPDPIWHQREMLFGFIGAGIAGFLLTATPSFTSTPPLVGVRLRGLVMVWLLSRALGLAPWLQPIAAALDLLLLLLVLAAAAPPLWRHARHRAFIHVLGLLAVVQGGLTFSLAGGPGPQPLQWLGAAVGVLAALVLVALARISMQIVNEALAARGRPQQYLARPPARNLAVFCILLFSQARLFWPYESITGWLGLAAAAAILNVMGDWHLGRVLADLCVGTLYAILALLAAGFGLLGVQLLWGLGSGISAVHLLTAGAMSLAMLAVLMIAGQRHTGRMRLARGAAVRTALGLVLAGALLRAGFGLLPPDWAVGLGHGLASLLFSAGFAVYLWRFWPWLSRRRVDGRPG